MLSVIGRAVVHMLRSIVGEEFGYDGEGNTQWYYIAGIFGTLMLIWNHNPAITAILFTIYAVLHILTVCIAGVNMLFIEAKKDSKAHAIFYFGFHVILFIAALITNSLWAIIFTVVVIAMYFLGTDFSGENIFWGECREKHPRKILVLNTIVFAILMVIIVQLRASATAKLCFVIGMMILHYIVDYLQGEGVEIREVTQSAFSCVGIRLQYWHDPFYEEKVKPNKKKAEPVKANKDKKEPDKAKQNVVQQSNGRDSEPIKSNDLKPEPKSESKNQTVVSGPISDKDTGKVDYSVRRARVR